LLKYSLKYIDQLAYSVGGSGLEGFEGMTAVGGQFCAVVYRPQVV
jgi:hypothetical protein